MKGKSIQAFLTALLVTCAAVSGAGCSSQSSAQSKTKTQLWDYKGVSVWDWVMEQPRDALRPAKPDEVEAKLATRVTDQFNKLGADGWEYVGNFGVSYTVIFKRPRQ